MTPTIVFDTYWRFAAERLAMFYRRLTDALSPSTTDPILSNFRFTNTYRAADRVSQYLISEVQAAPERSQAPREVFFRTILFKIFNRIETWEALERRLGPMTWANLDATALDRELENLRRRGQSIYSAAYIMPSPAYGHPRKHSNHIALLLQMMDDRLPERICQVPSLRAVYELILGYPGLGPFLAFQYTIDLNYSLILDFDEADLVVAGPGALDGISKCFSDTDRATPEDVIHWMTDRQDSEFARLGLRFPGLYGRPLQPIDCQNVFCEISKYARVAHPDIAGIAKRTRIKQIYRPRPSPLPPPRFPSRWGLRVISEQPGAKRAPVFETAQPSFI
jgi:hypothetical protein